MALFVLPAYLTGDGIQAKCGEVGLQISGNDSAVGLKDLDGLDEVLLRSIVFFRGDPDAVDLVVGEVVESERKDGLQT